LLSCAIIVQQLSFVYVCVKCCNCIIKCHCLVTLSFSLFVSGVFCLLYTRLWTWKQLPAINCVNCLYFLSVSYLHGMQTRSSDENSVRPSVCLSVRLSNACIVTKRKINLSRFLYHAKDHLASFSEKKNGWWLKIKSVQNLNNKLR